MVPDPMWVHGDHIISVASGKEESAKAGWGGLLLGGTRAQPWTETLLQSCHALYRRLRRS